VVKVVFNPLGAQQEICFRFNRQGSHYVQKMQLSIKLEIL